VVANREGVTVEEFFAELLANSRIEDRVLKVGTDPIKMEHMTDPRLFSNIEWELKKDPPHFYLQLINLPRKFYDAHRQNGREIVSNSWRMQIQFHSPPPCSFAKVHYILPANAYSLKLHAKSDHPLAVARHIGKYLTKVVNLIYPAYYDMHKIFKPGQYPTSEEEEAWMTRVIEKGWK